MRSVEVGVKGASQGHVLTLQESFATYVTFAAYSQTSSIAMEWWGVSVLFDVQDEFSPYRMLRIGSETLESLRSDS